MILRDPIHGLIAFEGAREQVVHALLRTREVQRLRRVRQLGLASLVFPGRRALALRARARQQRT